MKRGSVLFVVATVLCVSGCAQYMAFSQPGPFKPTISKGATRGSLTSELGSPIAKEETDAALTETYKYSDGGSKNNGWWKTLRVILYTGGDVFTLFLSQLIWMPMEKFGFAATEHRVEVDYTQVDGKWKVSSFEDNVVTQ